MESKNGYLLFHQLLPFCLPTSSVLFFPQSDCISVINIAAKYVWHVSVTVDDCHLPFLSFSLIIFLDPSHCLKSFVALRFSVLPHFSATFFISFSYFSVSYLSSTVATLMHG